MLSMQSLFSYAIVCDITTWQYITHKVNKLTNLVGKVKKRMFPVNSLFSLKLEFFL